MLNPKPLILLLLPTLLMAQQPLALSIEESVSVALKNNPGMKIDEEKISDARQSLYQAIGSALPTASFQGSKILDEKIRPIENFFYVPGVTPDPTNPITYLMVEPTLEMDMTNDYQVDLQVVQPLFMGGKIALGTLMAKQGLTLVQSQVDQSRNELAYSVIQAYLGLLVAREFVEVATEGYETAQEFYEISDLLYKQGMISRLDLLQAEVQAANLLPQKIRSENGMIQAESGLRLLLGTEPGIELTLTDRLSYEPEVFELENLQARALAHRPELRQMDLSRSLAGMNVALARTNYLPNAALSFSYSKFGDENVDFDTWNDSKMVALGLSYDLFNGGVRYSKLRQAKIGLRQAEYGYEALCDAILFEVERAFLSLSEAEKNILSQKKTVAQAEEAARLARIQYREGTITNLQANQIQMNLTAARANYLQALFNYTLAKASIRKAIGEALYN